MNRKIQITLIGDSDEIEQNNRIAYEIGSYIAEKGWVLITGGRQGVMAASSKGAMDNKGLIVSLLPGEDVNDGNKYETIAIATGIGYARNSMNVLSADVVVAVGGGAGTLSEIAYAWAYNKPIIACEYADGWSRKLANQTVDHRRSDMVIGVKNPDELKKELEKLVNKK